jgi:hypothetical protein
MKMSEMFEQGNRKTTMALIAMILSIGLEKYGGGLGELKGVILSVLAIFTGGNIISKGIRAAEEVKKVKYAPVPEQVDVAPQVVTSELDPIVSKLVEHVNKLDNAAGAEIKALKEADQAVMNKLIETSDAVKSISDRLDTQVKNMSQVLNIINGMRNGQQAG